MESWKKDIIFSFLRLYNALYELYTDYSERLRKIADSAKHIWLQKEPVYYFKGAGEYPLPLNMHDEISAIRPEDDIHIFTIDESHSEWNNAATVREGRRHKLMQILSAEIVTDTLTYEVPSNLLTIHSHCPKQTPPTYEQWLQAVYSQTGYWSLRIPAKMRIITDMGEEKTICSASDFRQLME